MLSRRRSPALWSLALQMLAWLPLLPLYASNWPIAQLVVVQGGLALLLTVWWRLPAWWRFINAGFFPLAWLLSGAEVAPVWYLAAFALLAATSLGSLKTRVPLYLSSRRAIETVARLAPGQARVLDLGCGLGGWLAGLSSRRADLSLTGVEMAPFNWLVGRLRLAGRASVRLGSLWNEDLSRHDVVYAYLSPAPMGELWQKVEREMQPGSLFISNTFTVPGVPPDESIELDDLSHSRLLIWRR